MSNNIFANAASTVATMTITENGHSVASTTGSALLDLYSQVGALRDADKERIFSLFDKAVKEDKLLAAKILFYARDARGGTGERELFRMLAKYAAEKYPDILTENLELIPEFGRWDDLYALVGTPLEKKAFRVMYDQLMKDIMAMDRKEPISLLAKWLKSCNTSSEESRRLGQKTWRALGFANEKFYRRTLTELRNYIRIVEAQMSKGNWSEIEYDKVPSRAGMIYRKAFKKHDEERYADYISSVKKGEKKINAAMNTPHDLVHAYVGEEIGRFAYGYDHIEEDPTIEVMWKNLPDFVKTGENILCMVDVSGSMYGRPIEVSTGLGMYFAQHNRGAFHNLFMTFESRPSFVKLNDDASFLDNLRTTFKAAWGGSTDLNRACKELLLFAQQHKVPQADMPTRLIIISDMEIDEATRVYSRYTMLRSNANCLSDILHVDELSQMYAKAGYKMPQVIYWNVQSRHNHFHTRSDVPGTMLASGSSPAVFEAVLAMKDLDITPYVAMLEVLNSKRYESITV